MSRKQRVFSMLALAIGVAAAAAQDQSVKPGINDAFRDPDIKQFVGRFEVESREVFARRQEIVRECQIAPGDTVADIGAGTGLFTRLFAEAVGPKGRVVAVEIAPKFLDHIRETSRAAGLVNVETLLCKADSTDLPPESVDVAFVCDTYHHFEFPLKTMASLARALRPGGRVILIDFRRVEGESSDWVLGHVRAGQEVFEAEIARSGLVKQYEENELLRENYFVVFAKPEEGAAAPGPREGNASARGPMGREPMGRGPGGRGPMGRGPGPETRAEQEVFHYLLANHARIRRVVKRLDNGVETLTESDTPEVARKIQEHVAAMHKRVQEGRGLRFWDDLFVALFKNHALIDMRVENTDKGTRVVETSKDPRTARLIQAHADVVSAFVGRGFEEARQNHPAP